MSVHAPVSVLFIGGTGTISASCVRRAVNAGMAVSVLNRGRNERDRPLPEAITRLTADVGDHDGVHRALGGASFDAVVNFLSYDAGDAEWAVGEFGARTRQYVHISTASLYGKPVLQVPIVESTPVHNRYVEYSRRKIAAERVLIGAYETSGFPVTIVRPSHTYDDVNPPLPGGWTVVDRIARGAEIAVHGDGTSLWTLTHADDFAQGLIGLLANPRAIGETFHITSDDVYTWDQIYSIVGDALGMEVRLRHIPSEFYPIAAPAWGWSELFLGDLGHSAIFDNTKIRRFVPDFLPVETFHRAVPRMLAWRAKNPEQTAPDAATDEIYDRLLTGYHRSREVFASLAPEAP